MRTLHVLVMLFLVFPILSGCWDRLELNDWAFVQAAGIDLTDDGRIRLTTQIYKPGGTQAQELSPGKSSSFFNITSESSTVFGASLRIDNELGRKLQWSHMEALLVGENFSRKRNIGDVLDFFSRSNEPKSSISIIITKGDAYNYLSKLPFIDNNAGQQLSSSIKTTEEQSGLSNSVSLTDLSIYAKQPSATFLMPLVYSTADQMLPPSNTTAIFRFPEGKLLRIVPSSKSPYLLMLRNQFRSGIINIPCPNNKTGGFSSESFKILRLETNLSPRIINGNVTLDIKVFASGSVMELTCSQLTTGEETNRFTEQVERILKKKLEETMRFILAEKTDVIDVSARLHRYHNRLWKKWEQDWPERFSKSNFTIETDVQLIHTGIDSGQPFTSSLQ
ncbi:hypothetical protein BK133_20905 [Paenibacillus sp. FSL H8-0548]|uniref:Ger(x)C family spore germination protein n=1 Tax=Paenibacillus sp. FSL H8-0548 TaxID=1920422 RepID=UPI00096FCA97|nr:Ger(x)C family spore germination protein [Paenibacillus sp. FSL H8-0548]OMF25785.1 hypothetical protein BK133_20905 [Paenibacillus sp. FSL H8-0548]